jgi:5-hydroxyisourate hydrolase
MITFPKIVFLSLFAASCTAAAAQTAPVANPLSVHVLNLETGTPTPGVEVELQQRQKDNWVNLASGKTDDHGRIAALFPQDKTMTEGDYKVVFKTGDYYKSAGKPTFFPEIPVLFHVENGGHYHIPLLLSQYGYSTYRGN